jgi:hypothetical protein
LIFTQPGNISDRYSKRNNLCPLSFIDVPKRAYVEGTLGVYELNRIELLRDVFVWGYERSVKYIRN